VSLEEKRSTAARVYGLILAFRRHRLPLDDPGYDVLVAGHLDYTAGIRILTRRRRTSRCRNPTTSWARGGGYRCVIDCTTRPPRPWKTMTARRPTCTVVSATCSRRSRRSSRAV